MTPRLRRLVRTALVAAHILAAMGWLALLMMLVLNPPAEVPTGLLAGVVLVALGTGTVLALGSPYGLARYWWIIGKFGASLLLAVLGGVALLGWLPAALAYGGRIAALVVLFAAVCVSVAKPRARTPWGHPATGRHAKGREIHAGES